MNDDQVKHVIQQTVNFVHNTPMGLQNFRKNKEFEHAVSRIDATVPFKGASGTVTASCLTSDSKEDQLRDHITRFRGIVLLKVGKDDRAHEVVVPSATELHQILGCFAAEERPVIMRLLLEEFAVGERKCHATLTTFLLTFFAMLFADSRQDFKRLMAKLWSIGEVRTLLLASYVWSNPTKYLQQGTIQIPTFDGEVPERWKRLALPSLRTGQEDHVKSEEEKYYDAPATPVKAEAANADEKKVMKAFHRLMAADAPGPSGAYAMDVKEQKPPKRPHSDDRLQATPTKRQRQGPATVHDPIAKKTSKKLALEGPLGERKLSDVDGIDDFMAKRMMEKKGFDLPSLFGQLLVMKLCRMAFVKWLMKTVAIGQEDAERCYKSLREYADKNVVGK